MRFSENGYYIEQYIKCDNCGVLIYGDGLSAEQNDQTELIFCTQWCIEWHAQKLAGIKAPVVDLEFAD